METSVYQKKIFLENPFFPFENTVFVRKIQVLTPKTRFSHIKDYFISETVFYSENLSFPTENF